MLGGITVVSRIINLPRHYNLSLTLAMALQGFGEVFGLYDSGSASTTSCTSPC